MAQASLSSAPLRWYLAFHLLVNLSVYLRVLISIGAGSALYFALARAFKVKELDFFLDALPKGSRERHQA